MKTGYYEGNLVVAFFDYCHFALDRSFLPGIQHSERADGRADDVLFVPYEKSRNIKRNMVSVAGLKKSFFAEIDKVENHDDFEKLRVKSLGREKRILAAVLRSLGGMPSVVYFNALIAR